MKTPSHAASSGFISIRSLPSNVMLPGCHMVRIAPRQYLRQRALARSIRSHDRMDFAGIDRKVDAFQNLVTTDFHVQVANLQQTHPSPRVPSSSLHGLSSDAAFQAHAQQLLRLDRKLHWQFAKHLFAEAIDDHRYRVLRLQPPLLQIKKLILADLRS